MESTGDDPAWARLFSSDSSGTKSWASSSTTTKSPELSIIPREEIVRNNWITTQERDFLIASIPNSIQKAPWQNSFEHQMYNAYYSTHQQTMTKPGMDDATREIWLNLVPKIALNSEGALFALLLSIGSMHTAIKCADSDYPYFRKDTRAARLWKLSILYFSEALTKFRGSILSKQVFETNPEVFCVTALVLSFRTSLNANHRHTEVAELYDDILSWFTSSLGYIDLGGFFNQNLHNTQLGDIMKANPQATYHFYTFLEMIKAQDFPYFDYLHPRTDQTGHVDPRDQTAEALEAYTMSIKLIGWVYHAAINGALKSDIFAMFHMVPYNVPKHFLIMLRRARPRAIAVLAHHIALQAFFGVFEHLQFWPREHIHLLREIVPGDWAWALRKAMQVVEQAEMLRAGIISSFAPMSNTQIRQLEGLR